MGIFKVLWGRGEDNPRKTSVGASKPESSLKLLENRLRTIYKLLESGKQESFEQALILSKELAQDPRFVNNHESHFVQGLSSLHLGDNQDAIDCFSRVISIKPDDKGAYRNRACALACRSDLVKNTQRGKPIKKHLMKRAKMDLCKALEWEDGSNNKSESMSYKILAFIHKKLGEVEEAVKSIEKAIKLDPGNKQLLLDHEQIVSVSF